MTVAMFFLKF